MGQMSMISVNGMTLQFDGVTLKINGKEIDISKVIKKDISNKEKSFSRGNKETEFNKSGSIDGDVVGNVRVTGDKVTLIIKGDVTGNITGDCEIEVGGDLVGNVVGGRVR